jgi:hypothetical protein
MQIGCVIDIVDGLLFASGLVNISRDIICVGGAEDF